MQQQQPTRRGKIQIINRLLVSLLTSLLFATPVFSANHPNQSGESAATPPAKSAMRNKAEWIARARGMVAATSIPVAVMRMETMADGSTRPVCTIKTRPAPVQRPGVQPQAQARGH